MSTYRIAVLKGDGIGPEVVTSARTVLESVSKIKGLSLELIDLAIGLEAYEKTGRTLPPDTLERLKGCDGWIMGPLQTGSYPKDDLDHPMSSGKIRKYFDLYSNIRPVRSLGQVGEHGKIDLVIVRENTEDFFPNINLFKGYGEFWTDRDTVLSLRVIRRSSCARIATTAFELARSRAKKKLVTAVHKSNVLMEGDGLFLEEVKRVRAGYSDVDLEEKLVDSTAMELVLAPEKFDVILTTNLFGDILSDEAAGLVGGLGICPSLNSGEDYAMAQAVHGSAPDIAGKGIANPASEILSASMLLGWLYSHKARQDENLREAADLIERAVLKQLSSQEPRERTSDLGGTASTDEFTSRLLDAMGR